MLKIVIDLRPRAINLPSGSFNVLQARFSLPIEGKVRVGSYKDVDEMLKELRRLINTRLE